MKTHTLEEGQLVEFNYTHESRGSPNSRYEVTRDLSAGRVGVALQAIVEIRDFV